jgi:hypothetical protein
MTIIDITYTINREERYGRRRMYNNHTGETWWDPPEPLVPEGYFDGPPNPPLGLSAIAGTRPDDSQQAVNEVELSESLGPVEPLPPASADSLPADPAPPVKPARKPRKKNG